MAKFILSAFADEAGSTLAEQISALRDNGIDFIEPRNIGGRGILSFSDDEIIEIKEELDKSGIKVSSLGSPIGKYPIEADFLPHLEDTKRALEIARLLDTKNIRMFSFFVKQNELAKFRDEVISRLHEMCRLADEYGIALCHENESLIYGEKPTEVSELISAVPSLYGIFDPANYRMNNADVYLGIEATLKRFRYMHVKDAIFDSQTIVPVGEGEGKIAEIINIINERVEGEVYLTLEPHLHIFDAYSGIDEHELRGKYSFSSSREAFDFAADALKNLLTANGYERNIKNQWIKSNV